MELSGVRKDYIVIKNMKHIKINIENIAECQYNINNRNSNMKANLMISPIMQRQQLNSCNIMKKCIYRGHTTEGKTLRHRYLWGVNN